MGPKHSCAAVGEAVKCEATTVRYWLKRWKQLKDLSDSIRSGRAQGTTLKQDEQIACLAEQKRFVTARDIANKLKKTEAIVNERTALERSRSQLLSKPLCSPKCIEKIV